MPKKITLKDKTTAPIRYAPTTLTSTERKKQIKALEASREAYKRGSLKERPKVSSFQSKPSQYTGCANKYFGQGNTKPSKIAHQLANGNSSKEKRLNTGFEEIINKGKGAYFSSGSRPNQSPFSWGVARVFSVLFGGNARNIDKDIVSKYNIPILKCPH